jgi:hypothetical protein
MRQILINHAEARRAAKRGGEAERVPLDDVDHFAAAPEIDLIALDEVPAATSAVNQCTGYFVNTVLSLSHLYTRHTKI